MLRKFVLIVSVIIFIPIQTYALDGIEFFTGYLHANVNKHKDDYNGIPLLVALNYDLKPAINKFVDTSAMQSDINFVLEPFINTIVEPNNNIEVGSNFLLKYVFPLTDTFQPYIKGGLGILYMSEHTSEQGSQYNFLPQAGVGMHIFFRKNIACSFEYRYRHLSNASSKHPNRGIDANMFLGGISIFLK